MKSYLEAQGEIRSVVEDLLRRGKIVYRIANFPLFTFIVRMKEGVWVITQDGDGNFFYPHQICQGRKKG